MPENARDKRVWILGAGFSRHAGGPLMNDLFSQGSDELFDTTSGSLQPRLRRVGKIYRSHSQGRRVKLWSDPEQFMETLDNPIFAPGRLSRIAGTDESLKELRLLTKIRFCEEVQRPVRGFCAKSDRGAPYVHWLKRLDSRDVLVTFNYDLLIETAAREAGVCLNKVGPSWSDDDLPLSSEWPVLLKLHGSVDWFQSEDGRIGRYETGDDHMNCLANNRMPFIGTPGNAKGEMKAMMGNSWKRATEAIRNARSIHIVGYRFPQSDSNSVLALAREMTREECEINIVLGKGKGSPEVDRIQNLLKYVAGNDSSNVVDLYAQDYMSADRHWARNLDPPRILH